MVYLLMVYVLSAPGSGGQNAPQMTKFATFDACRAAEQSLRDSLKQQQVQFTASCLALPTNVQAARPEVFVASAEGPRPHR